MQLQTLRGIRRQRRTETKTRQVNGRQKFPLTPNALTAFAELCLSAPVRRTVLDPPIGRPVKKDKTAGQAIAPAKYILAYLKPSCLAPLNKSHRGRNRRYLFDNGGVPLDSKLSLKFRAKRGIPIATKNLSFHLEHCPVEGREPVWRPKVHRSHRAPSPARSAKHCCRNSK